MTTPAHYPHSYTFLATHIERISRGIVIVGMAGILWVVVVFAAIGAWQVLT